MKMLMLRFHAQVLLLFLAVVLFATAPHLGLAAADLSVPSRFPSQGTIPTPDTLQGCGGARFVSSNGDFETEVLVQVNRIRQEHHLPPLKRHPDLDASARFHAADMAMENYFSHSSYDLVNGELVESCAWSERIRTYYGDWWSVAENIAAGFATPADVVQAWMDSPGHRANILSETNWEIGIGYFEGPGLYRRYWVQDFARPNDRYPLVLDGDAPVTETGDLSVYIYGDWKDVRFRTDDGPWSPWRPFQRPLTYRLEGVAGLHTVHAEMRTEEGFVKTASDEIVLSQSNIQPALSDLPERLTFTFFTETGQIQPESYSVQPVQGAGASSYTWRVEVQGSWINVTPAQGSGSEALQIIPSITGADDVSETTATLQVSLQDSQGQVMDQEQVELFLNVAAGAPQQVFIPHVERP